MTRDAINLTLSEPLRRAQVRQRLDALAQITGLAQAQLAGRALTIGIGIIEADLSQIFTGIAPSIPTPSPTAPSIAPPGTAGHCDAQQSAASPRTDALTSATVSVLEPEPAPPSDGAQDTPVACAEQPEPAPPIADRLSTQDAARALGYRSKDAFAQHVQRHSELKSCGLKSGSVWTWDLGKLRAEYEQRGWSPK